MKLISLAPYFAVAAFCFAPNEGSECKLTCKPRVPISHCPSGHYVGGSWQTCASSQHGCLDRDGNGCGGTLNRPTLCVVDGPCGAGPAGCLDDKTGAHNWLPAGVHVGHCPKPLSPEALCEKCVDNCMDKADGVQYCFKGCGYCDEDLLLRERYFAAEKNCKSVHDGNFIPDQHHLKCVFKQLERYVPEFELCPYQHNQTLVYCEQLKYPRFTNESQICTHNVMGPDCGETSFCKVHTDEAEIFCENKSDYDDSGPIFQDCVANAVAVDCADKECERSFYPMYSTCLVKPNLRPGTPAFESCLRDLLKYRCPAHAQCGYRSDDAFDYCLLRNYRPKTPEIQVCVHKILDVCPTSMLCEPCRKRAENRECAYEKDEKATEECLRASCNVTCAETAPEYVNNSQQPIQLEL